MRNCLGMGQQCSGIAGNSAPTQSDFMISAAVSEAKIPSTLPKLWTKKRQAVAAETTAATNISFLPKSEETKKMISASIIDNLLFQEMPSSALEVIIDSMRMWTVASGTDIIKQGDIGGHEFYVLEEGMCDVLVAKEGKKPKKILTCTAGSAFGELALLYSAARAATVTASTQCRLWVMERQVYNTVKRNFTQVQNAERHKLLESVTSLKHLSAHHRAMLVDALKQVEFAAGKQVVTKGNPGNDFYIIKQGTASVRDGSKQLDQLGPGSYFGERALLGAEVRAADVVANSKLICYTLSRTDFNDLLGSADEVWRFEALQKVPLLFSLTESQLWQLAKVMQTEMLAKGQVVFKKGSPGDSFYIIKEGIFTCCDENGRELARISEGSCFGELALLRQEKRAATVIATTKAEVLVMSRDLFQRNLGNLTQLRHVWRFEALRRVPLLCTLDPPTMAKVAEAMVSVQFKQGQDIIVEGEIGDKFYIVEYGRLGVFQSSISTVASSIVKLPPASPKTPPAAPSPVKKPHHKLEYIPATTAYINVPSKLAVQPSAATVIEKPILQYQAGNYFGELALIRNEPRAATVRAMTPVSLLVVERSHFTALMGPLLPTMVKQAEVYLAKARAKGGLTGLGDVARTNKEVELSKVKVLSMLGSGGFGQVLLVEYYGEHFALKCMKKDFVLEQGLVDHVTRERDTLMECDSPFLVKLQGTAQDDQYLYMMMEAVMGGELFSYLQTRASPLDEAHARFYAASVILGLDYLHQHGSVYRDLKPENLLIDLKGYVKVTDFGFVKQLDKGGKTYTLCGTPEYLAPEIIMNKGHNQAADWWALGVLIYELCTGMPPFMHEDRLMMFRRICQRDLFIPKTFSKPLRSLIEGLLTSNPVFRLGSGKTGVAEIKSHPWFNGLDWEAFASKSLPAPYLPKRPQHGGDAVNFTSGRAPAAKLLKFTAQLRPASGAFSDF
ncbi:hypothetical protein CEUSTIGMA_g212.t1 [Chlamydomonas eustigma]|uniref:cGMP-dependent protein kinase n=1 Tax=Chlamydomonas eustigma TaxID=1157962 RepID=A0A250WPY2_9CHLO|nr:hypothetical protein CEUSTIGMA_g212.t1 [Chlamydomonas eustigma]|eukprot:GAX72756.1 hypothetical protein CEUSTIGMA_g212.t1 [Chlamydomonas eustigma]